MSAHSEVTSLSGLNKSNYSTFNRTNNYWETLMCLSDIVSIDYLWRPWCLCLLNVSEFEQSNRSDPVLFWRDLTFYIQIEFKQLECSFCISGTRNSDTYKWNIYVSIKYSAADQTQIFMVMIYSYVSPLFPPKPPHIWPLNPPHESSIVVFLYSLLSAPQV